MLAVGMKVKINPDAQFKDVDQNRTRKTFQILQDDAAIGLVIDHQDMSDEHDFNWKVQFIVAAWWFAEHELIVVEE